MLITKSYIYLHKKVTACCRLGNKSKIQVFLPAQKRYTMRYVREKLYIVMTYNPTYLHHYIVTEMLLWLKDGGTVHCGHILHNLYSNRDAVYG